MKKNKILIKKRIVNEMKKAGINSISPDSFIILDEHFLNNLKIILKALKEELYTNGKKIAGPKDVKKVLDSFGKENSFEI